MKGLALAMEWGRGSVELALELGSATGLVMEMEWVSVMEGLALVAQESVL